MNSEQFYRSEPAGHVVPFPAQSGRRAKDGQASKPRPAELETTIKLAKYEFPEGGDDYRRRMLVNVVAFAFIVLLTIAGIWIAETLAQLRKNQDCVLSGRRNCAEISAPAH